MVYENGLTPAITLSSKWTEWFHMNTKIVISNNNNYKDLNLLSTY